MTSTDFYIDRLKVLVGSKIVGVVHDDEGYFGIEVRDGQNRSILWILSDDEGNGPGSFDIQRV